MMERAKRLFVVLGLMWVIAILMNLIFPRAMLTWHTYGVNLVYHLTAAAEGSKESQMWLLFFGFIPACVILVLVFAGIGVQSVIARVIKKARA